MKQSIPLAAVMSGGQFRVSSGSTSAMSGTRLLKPSVPICEITAFLVASLPVPEVVGTAIKGSLVPGCSLLPIPSRKSIIDSFLYIMADNAFPASITLPPPIPTTSLISSLLNLLTA